jgi:hypothetical protein
LRFAASANTRSGGDRCNGGIDSIRLTGTTLRYVTRMTPYDLINASASHDPSKTRAEALSLLLLPEHQSTETRKESGPVGGWAAYDDIHACALCCSGSMTTVITAATEPWNIEEFITVDEDDLTSATDPSSANQFAKDDRLNACLGEALGKASDSGRAAVPLKQWRARMLALPKQCGADVDAGLSKR